MIDLDRLIVSFDRGLRTVFGPATSVRSVPAQELPEAELEPARRELSAALMRVNHTGEICAQALYQGQALTARSSQAQAALERAAHEETEHLAWTERRIEELGGRKSMLNPLWYAGSFAIGAAAGLLGDRWNLGFLGRNGTPGRRAPRQPSAKAPGGRSEKPLDRRGNAHGRSASCDHGLAAGRGGAPRAGARCDEARLCGDDEDRVLALNPQAA